MEKKDSDNLEVANNEEEITTEEQESTVDEQVEEENVDESSDDSPSDEDEQKDPYAEELEKLKAENEKKDALIKEKDSALKQERLRRKEAEANKLSEDNDADVDDDKLSRSELEELLRERDVETLARMKYQNDSERKLTLHHYKNSINKTGDPEADLSLANALANRHVVEQQKKVEQERIAKEREMINFSGGKSYSRESSGSVSDPVKREAVKILESMGIKDAKKYAK